MSFTFMSFLALLEPLLQDQFFKNPAGSTEENRICTCLKVYGETSFISTNPQSGEVHHRCNSVKVK